MYAGPQYLNDGKPNFGMFLDSSPERWGRVLIFHPPEFNDTTTALSVIVFAILVNTGYQL